MASIANYTAGLSLDMAYQTSTPQEPIDLDTLPAEVLKVIASFVFAEYVDVDDKSASNDELVATTNEAYPQKSVLKTATPTYLTDFNRRINGDKRTPYFTRLMEYGNLSLEPGTTSILLVNHRIHKIGAEVFYGLYKFQTYAAESFRLKFLRQIGKHNASFIRHLRMGLPFPVKVQPSETMGRYVRMLNNELPSLKVLEITTEFGRWRYSQTYSPNNTWIECHRGMLWFAAWVPRSHPVLKFAVWSEENTVTANKLDDVYDGFFDSRPDVRLTVTVTTEQPKGMRVMEHPKYIEARNAELPENEKGEVVGAEVIEPASDILLDTYAIRRMGWKALATKKTCRPYAYQLQPDASSSEAKKPAQYMTTSSIDFEETYFHNKSLKYPADDSQEFIPGPTDISKYRAAQAANAANVDEEAVLFRGPPRPQYEEAEVKNDIVEEENDHSREADEKAGGDDAGGAAEEVEDDNGSWASTDGWGNDCDDEEDGVSEYFSADDNESGDNFSEETEDASGASEVSPTEGSSGEGSSNSEAGAAKEEDTRRHADNALATSGADA